MSMPATSVRAAQSKQNVYFAKRNWGSLSRMSLAALRELTRSWGLCVATGDLLYLDEKWYVTHSGLLRLARRCHCYGILVQPVPAFCDAGASRWAFSATVYKSPKCKGFVGFGDAAPPMCP